MRLFKDDLSIETWGRWYWCPEGAQKVPFLSPFKSSHLLPDMAKQTYELGEIFELHEYTDGIANPRYTGQHVCGDADHWLHGALWAERGTPLSDADGVPPCCQALPAPAGGVSIDGDSEQGLIVGSAFDEGYDSGYDSPD
jgi:hypothetical protein